MAYGLLERGQEIYSGSMGLLMISVFFILGGAAMALLWWLTSEEGMRWIKGVRELFPLADTMREREEARRRMAGGIERDVRGRLRVIPPEQLRRLKRRRMWFDIDRELYRH